MKKKIYIVLLLLLGFSFMIYAQESKTVFLKWEVSESYIEGSKIKVPIFQNEYFDYHVADNKIYFKNSFKSSYNNAQLVGFETQTISKQDLFDLNIDNLPKKIDFQSDFGWARDESYLKIWFNPIFIENGIIKKVTSIEYQTNILASRSQFSVQSIPTSSNSVLATGEWYKFSISKSGIYRISKSFLESIGFNTNVNPRNIKIYGNGGGMLPLQNNMNSIFDLEENAILFVGEEDGRFDNQDYILFYAEGVDQWSYENQTHNNLFEDKAYYYVTHSNSQGKRIQEAVQPDGTSSQTFTIFDDYQYYEKDLINIGRLGRKWLGEDFGFTSSRTFDFEIPNLITSAPVSLFVRVAASSQVSTSFDVKVNNQSIGNINLINLPANTSGVENFLNSTINVSSNSFSVRLDYNNNGVPSSRGYLDFITIKSKRNLSGYGKQFSFFNNNQATSIGIGTYTISNATSINQIWDVTDKYNVVRYNNTNGATFSFKVNLGSQRTYIAVDVNDFFQPSRVTNSKLVNQNLKGTIFNNAQGNFQDIDYLIITPTFLKNQADKLAQFHRNYNQYNVKVVTLENIYEEFSSGKQDVVAIRNFIRYVYSNASTPSRRVKFVNLFGDASFDYKDKIPNNNNIVPVYHGLNPANSTISNDFSNFNLISSYMTDDFYGLMDENEGDMLSSMDLIDVAVGRMIVSSVSQAEEMIQKIIDYHDFESYGRWRNSYVILSDDADNSSDFNLQVSLNNMMDTLNQTHPFINAKKIHTDAFEQVVNAGGERYPKAKNEFLNMFQLGALAINYYGHGGEDGLARERLFDFDDAQNLFNPKNYPLFITMTCEFSRFDNPYKTSGGEFTYLNKNGGAIALVTTTRLIFVPVASSMNDDFNELVYAEVDGENTAISEALRKAKLLNNSDNRRVVFYIGDPALRLAIPKPKVVLTEINGVPVNQQTDVLKALSFVTMKGQVQTETGALMSNYNGDLAIQIYDKNITRETLGNNGVTNNTGTLLTMGFTTLGEAIFRGNATITNGQFEFSFVVPKDIKVAEGNGKVSFYAKSNVPNLQDQTGYDFSVKIGGVNVNAAIDETPPVVRLYMNDETFVNGGITNESPLFLAFLEDENGINTASGIGHDIIAILDGDEANPFVLNDYYETENDNYKKGSVTFPFRNLSPGLHTITFKAWDVYNNLITAEIQFVVLNDENLTLERILNYPNPFVNYTEFWFNHNRPNEILDVQVQIFTITGKVVKTINQSVSSEGFLCREIKWDGLDDFGDKIGKGVYVYKLKVKSTLDGKTAEKIEKLVIL